MKLCPKCQKQFSDDANFCPVDAARLVPLDASGGSAGADSLSARFELGPKLGGSRTGAVHRATDKTTGKAVVVKLVSPAVIQLPGVAQRIERELRQLERVQSAGVARVLASGKRGADETWVAMELLDGAHTLEQAITARGPIPPDQAADLIEVVGEALIEAAQVGVVHRDLAPKNVLFAGQDVKLINFSLPVPTEKVPGVAEFVAPEQVDGRPVDQRSNLYSLGALYYYVLTGQTVFAGTSPAAVHDQHKTGTIRPVSQLVGTVAAGSPIETVIMRALDRSPTKRFLTVRQFVDEVARVGHGEVIELKTPAAAAPRPNRPKGDLVQTLMGMAKGPDGKPIAAPAPAPKPAPAATPAFLGTTTPGPGPGPSIANAPTVGTPIAPTPAAPVVAQPKPTAQPAVMAQTMIGVSHGPGSQAPAQAVVAPQPAAPVIAPQPAPQPQAPIGPMGVQSPWAGPNAQAAPAPVVPQAPVMPQPAAPVLAAPIVAAPQVAQQPAGKKKAEEPSQKGKFRETMWFKKGDLDAQAAVAAAEERARTGKDVATDKADSMPIDERYKDDGSISRGDKEKYSLRTGATQMMQAMRPEDAGRSMNKVSEDALIGEMKSGRTKVMLGIALAVVALIILIVIVAR